MVAGCLLVFIPAVGEFVIPDLLGGSQTLMIGKTLWNEFFANRDWPVSSAVAVMLLLVLIVPIMIFQNAQARAQEQGDERELEPFQHHLHRAGLRVPLSADRASGHLLLQQIKLVTVWGGFSTKWYYSLFHNQGLMDAAWVTLRVGARLGHGCHGAGHARRRCRSPATRVFAAACCFPEWCSRRSSCRK